MSFRMKFYLDPEKVKPVKQESGNSHFVGNTFVRIEHGLPVLEVYERWVNPPDELKAFVTSVQIETANWVEELFRQPGVYRNGNAEGTVDTIPATAEHHQMSTVKVAAPTKEEALVLWDQIMEGKILPEKDYGVTQIPSPTFDPDRISVIQKQIDQIALDMLQASVQRLAAKIAG